MGPGRPIVALLACSALAGCGSSQVITEGTVPDTTPHGSPPQILIPESVERERSQRAFEQAFEAYIRSGRGGSRAKLRPATIRFRTPCNLEGAHLWRCEGWGLNTLEHCYVESAAVTGTGVVGTFEKKETSKAEAGYALCANGDHEGRPPGDLQPEP